MEQNIKNTKLKVPEGFRNLLEALTCEILRVQPKNIPKFAAEYLKGRLIARQENGYDECLLGSQIDGFYKHDPYKEDKSVSSSHNDVSLSNGASPSNSVGSSNKKTQTPINPDLDKSSKVPSNEPNNTRSNDEVKRCIIHYEDENQAASKIQAGFHGYKCRQQIKEQHRAAEKIQAGYRGYACRKDIKQQNEAATKIQTKFKEFQSKKETVQGEGGKDVDNNKDKMEEKSSKGQIHFDSKDQAATAIQSGYRGYLDRKKLNKQTQAATKIQAGYRGYITRKLRRSQSEAAVTIQSNYRGHRARELQRNRSDAAVKIQKTYRGYKVRKTQHDKSHAATTIQSHYRGYRTRKDLKKSQESKLPKTNDLLGTVPYDTRASFSIPAEDVKFDGDLDSDSDIDIDKVVDEMEAKKKTKESDG